MNMIKFFNIVLLILLLVGTATQAGIPITVENFSFEEPGTGKKTREFSRKPLRTVHPESSIVKL